MAVVNPFRQINASLPPLAPAPPPALGFDPDDMGAGTVPQLPQGKRPQVFGPTAQDRQETMLGGRLEGDYQKDLHPWGTPENHPGVWGKIGHALSVATGGPNRRLMEESGLEGRLNKLAGLQSQLGEQGAQTSHLKEETAEMPGKAESEEGLQGAETRHANDEAANLENPNAVMVETDQGIFMRNPKTNELTPLTYQGNPLNPFNKVPPKGMEKGSIVGPNGKPIEANYHSDTGKWTDTSGKEIVNPVPYERPNQAGMVTLIAPDPNNPGGGVVERVGAGAHIVPGSQTTAGFSSMNTPTTTVRTAAERAKIVNESIPGVLADIEKNKTQMGPLMGRWNDFMQGKVGMDNPDFAALRMDFTLIATAVALAHAQGRLPENLREEFVRAINAPQQTPENLVAAIKAVQPWMARMEQAGERPGATQENGPSGASKGGMIRALDPNGVLHEAPAGTPLPAGWKAQ
jgi:hypothetical protein